MTALQKIKNQREIKKANKRIAVIKGQRAALVRTCEAMAQMMKANNINVMQRKEAVNILCLVDDALSRELDELKNKINMLYLNHEE